MLAIHVLVDLIESTRCHRMLEALVIVFSLVSTTRIQITTAAI
jgi:hypothetical protein